MSKPLPPVPDAGVAQLAAGLANCLRWNVSAKTVAAMLANDPRLDPAVLEMSAEDAIEMFRGNPGAWAALQPHEQKLRPYIEQVLAHAREAA